jgi:hypothetical protein
LPVLRYRLSTGTKIAQVGSGGCQMAVEAAARSARLTDISDLGAAALAEQIDIRPARQLTEITPPGQRASGERRQAGLRRGDETTQRLGDTTGQ